MVDLFFLFKEKYLYILIGYEFIALHQKRPFSS